MACAQVRELVMQSAAVFPSLTCNSSGRVDALAAVSAALSAAMTGAVLPVPPTSNGEPQAAASMHGLVGTDVWNLIF